MSSSLTLTRYCALAHLQIAPSGRGNSVLDRTLKQRGCTRKIAMRVESFLAAPSIVSASDLIVTAPRSCLILPGIVEGLCLLPLPVEVQPLHLELYWDARRGDEPRLRWFRQIIQELAPGV